MPCRYVVQLNQRISRGGFDLRRFASNPHRFPPLRNEAGHPAQDGRLAPPSTVSGFRRSDVLGIFVMMSDQILFIISGPSGSGKETVISYLIKTVPGLMRISTYATRAMRPGEAQGQPYIFVSDADFDRLVKSGDIFENETVYGSFRYGSPRAALTGSGEDDNIMELDPNGYRRMRKARKGPTVGIFLMVPDLKTLTQRITARHPENDVTERIETAKKQIRECGDYDYIVMNDDLKKCCEEAATICEAERIRQRGKEQQRKFLSG